MDCSFKISCGAKIGTNYSTFRVLKSRGKDFFAYSIRHQNCVLEEFDSAISKEVA